MINIWNGQHVSYNSLNIEQVIEMAGMACMEACRLTTNDYRLSDLGTNESCLQKHLF